MVQYGLWMDELARRELARRISEAHQERLARALIRRARARWALNREVRAALRRGLSPQEVQGALSCALRSPHAS